MLEMRTDSGASKLLNAVLSGFPSFLIYARNSICGTISPGRLTVEIGGCVGDNPF